MESTPIAFFAEIQSRTERFRHECECRYLAAFETHDQRAVYLEGHKGVRDRRGAAAAERLRRDVWALMKRAGAPVEPQQEALFA